ncbi:ribonuclease CAF1 [Martensiomyces pterosporus]|nr:ribonuclease CAF1 [Martensiomyces pterosporus]
MRDSNLGAASATYNDVTRRNLEPLFDGIRAEISKAKFIAVDTEFTGLVLSNASEVFRLNTSEWVTRATNMEEKYKAMANIAKTHSLVSIGLSTFSKRHNRPGSFNVNNFNFTLQAQNSHLINPSSLAFLAQNGFDLGRQAMEGIRYFSGPNPRPVQVKTTAVNREGELIREVFLDVIRARVPLVVHNGLFDLVYLYQSFFGPLPDTYDSFAYDLFEMFPGGVYDTKYIAESLSPGTASYLAYLFHKSERIQKRRRDSGEPAVNARLKSRLKYDVPEENQQPSQLFVGNDSSRPYCEQFADHGHCRYGKRCSRSHDINFILDCQEREQQRTSAAETKEESGKDGDAEESGSGSGSGSGSSSGSEQGNKRKRDSSAEDQSIESSKILAALVENASRKRIKPTEPAKSPESAQSSQSTATSAATSTAAAGQETNMYHTAAYDAFMTGYIFASYRILLGEKIGEHINKVYLMGRPGQPLLVKAGMFSSNSITYRQTMPLVEKASDMRLKERP